MKYLFSNYDFGMKVAIDFASKVTPEKVAQHISFRSKECKLIMDAFCGVGGNTIQVYIIH